MRELAKVVAQCSPLRQGRGPVLGGCSPALTVLLIQGPRGGEGKGRDPCSCQCSGRQVAEAGAGARSGAGGSMGRGRTGMPPPTTSAPKGPGAERGPCGASRPCDSATAPGPGAISPLHLSYLDSRPCSAHTRVLIFHQVRVIDTHRAHPSR